MIALCSHGIPWEIATSMPDDTRRAWAIAVGIYEGGDFDFVGQKWNTKE